MNDHPRFHEAIAIEHDIAETRQRLSRDLAMLDREYALRNIFVHALRLTGSGEGNPRLGAVAKGNAVPLGLVGIGLVWMAFANMKGAMGRQFFDTIAQFWCLLETAVTGHGTNSHDCAGNDDGTGDRS